MKVPLLRSDVPATSSNVLQRFSPEMMSQCVSVEVLDLLLKVRQQKRSCEVGRRCFLPCMQTMHLW